MRFVRLDVRPTIRFSKRVWEAWSKELDRLREKWGVSRSLAADRWLREKLGIPADVTTKPGEVKEDN